MKNKTSAILTMVYPEVQNKIKANMRAYNKYISEFIEFRAKELYDIAPCDRIFFREEDYKNYFASTKIDESKVINGIDQTFYARIPNFNPRAAKDPFTMAQLCAIRYFISKNMKKEQEMAMVLLAFSGKFYPSIHYSSYPQTPPSQYRHVMEYIVNNELTEKFDLKSQGSVIGAIRSICVTWAAGYKSKFKDFDDDDAVYLIQQLHNRIKSFTKNIATLYYDAYKNKDQYLAYGTESLEQDNYRLSNSDALECERIVQKTMEKINTKDVDYKLCMSASDYNVRVNEVRSILQTIISDPKEQENIKELIGIMVTTYYAYGKKKDINNYEFITYSITAKPNSKDKDILREREIIETWLNEKSPAYRKRSKRLDTRNSYHRAVLAYFALVIFNANK